LSVLAQEERCVCSDGVSAVGTGNTLVAKYSHQGVCGVDDGHAAFLMD